MKRLCSILQHPVPDLGGVCLSPLGLRTHSVLFVHALVALGRRDGLVVFHWSDASLWRLPGPEWEVETNVRHVMGWN